MEGSLNCVVLKEGTSRVYQCIDRQYIYNLKKNNNKQITNKNKICKPIKVMCRHVYTSTEYDSPYFLRILKVNSYSFKETTRLNLNLHAPFMNWSKPTP